MLGVVGALLVPFVWCCGVLTSELGADDCCFVGVPGIIGDDIPAEAAVEATLDGIKLGFIDAIARIGFWAGEEGILCCCDGDGMLETTILG